MSALCVIPARGGSKRIPGKNIKDFLGKPIIAYPIQIARDSGLFEEVIVSTDCAEIVQVAEQYGATVPFLRPEICSSDTATTAEVLMHALDWYTEKGINWEYLCCLYPTAPLCTPQKLREGASLLLESGAPAVIPVAEFPYPILRSLKVTSSGSIEMNWPEYELTRSQDLPNAYHDAGQFYWIKVASFLEDPRLMPPGTLPLVLPRLEVVDIDTPEDWETAEVLYRVLNQ
jgi:pseudaminic acid cytidylyltransferase